MTKKEYNVSSNQKLVGTFTKESDAIEEKKHQNDKGWFSVIKEHNGKFEVWRFE